MRPHAYLVVLAITGACARHVEAPTAPNEWTPTLNRPSRYAGTMPTALPTPLPTPHEGCSPIQRLAMRVSGMTDDQIRKACE
jgi:hypothetical protein